MEMVDQYRYRAFISYSHADEKNAIWLHRWLEQYRIPKRLVERYALATNRLKPIFRDREELSSSSSLSDAIQTALNESETLIVICSPDAAASKWVDQEIETYKALGRADRIYCLTVAGDPSSSFPPAIRSTSEPLAADLVHDGKLNAALKIVAGILDLRFDELRQRDSLARQRRMLAIAGAALTGMVLAIGLATFAMIARQQAVDAREEADIQRKSAESEAETSKQVTEFLLSIFKQANPAFYRAAEPTASEILQQGALRLRHELRDQPEIRAQLLATIGSAYLGISRGKEAETLLTEALELQESQFGPQHLELVSTLQDLADAKGVFAGDDEAANRLNLRALEIQKVLGSHVAVATALIRLSHYTNREHLLLRALALIEAEDPESKVHGKALVELAYYYLEMGEFETSLDYFHRSSRFHEARGMQEELIVSLSGMAGLLGYIGEPHQAVSMLERAVSMAEKVYGINHPYTGSRINDLAVQHHIHGNLLEARPLYKRALDIAEEHLGPLSGLRRILLTNLGELERDNGSYPASERFFVELTIVYEEMGTEPPAYLAGQIALLRLAQKRYEEAKMQFDIYFAKIIDSESSKNPEHIPILKGYEKLIQEIEKNSN